MSRNACLSICVAFTLAAASCDWSTAEGETTDHEADHRHPETDPHSAEAGWLELLPEAVHQAGIRTRPVESILVRESITATAVVGPDESNLGHIRPLSNGIVREVFVQRGARVRKGQPLVSYDNVELGDLLGVYRSQQAELGSAEARRDVTRKVWNRGRELFEHQVISRNELELREAEYLQAEAEVRRWQAAIDQTAVRMRRFGFETDQPAGSTEDSATDLPELRTLTMLRAPFDGVVIDYDTSAGEVVAPERVLMTIANLSRVWVLADVFERDLGAVTGAQSAMIELEAYPDRAFEGRITYVGDLVDPHTRTVKVRCVVSNPGHLLKVGMFATVRIPTRDERRLPAVPADAVQVIGDRTAVFVQSTEGRFERRWVETGRSDNELVPVLSGLTAGELVVTEGSFSLKSELLREELGGGHAH